MGKDPILFCMGMRDSYFIGRYEFKRSKDGDGSF